MTAQPSPISPCGASQRLPGFEMTDSPQPALKRLRADVGDTSIPELARVVLYRGMGLAS